MHGFCLQVDNVSGQLDTVLDVNWEDLKANIEKVSKNPKITGH